MLDNFFVTALLITSMPSKRVLLNDSLKLWKKKKALWSKIRPIGKLFHNGDVPLDQEQPDAKSAVSTCIVVVKQPRFVQLQHVFSRTPSEAYAVGFLADLLIERLALWHELVLNDPPYIKESGQKDFNFRL